jgi:Alpha-kinase family
MMHCQLYLIHVACWQVWLLKLSSRYCTLEPHLSGDWTKWINNAGYVNKEDFSATLATFTHYTHHASDGELMVTDLQVPLHQTLV